MLFKDVFNIQSGKEIPHRVLFDVEASTFSLVFRLGEASAVSCYRWIIEGHRITCYTATTPPLPCTSIADTVIYHCPIARALDATCHDSGHNSPPQLLRRFPSWFPKDIDSQAQRRTREVIDVGNVRGYLVSRSLPQSRNRYIILFESINKK
jgi:hypothetical protein